MLRRVVIIFILNCSLFIPQLCCGQLYLEAELAEKAGQDSLAIQTYQEAFDTEQKDPIIWKKIANIYKKNGDFQSQANNLETYFKFAKKPPLQDYFALGIAWYNHQDYPKADSVFQIMGQKWPKRHLPFLMSARCAANQDHDTLAYGRYQSVIEILDPKPRTQANKLHLSEAYRFLIAFCYLKGDFDLVKGLQQKLDALK